MKRGRIKTEAEGVNKTPESEKAKNQESNIQLAIFWLKEMSSLSLVIVWVMKFKPYKFGKINNLPMFILLNYWFIRFLTQSGLQIIPG